jgi:hypothetical protein
MPGVFPYINTFLDDHFVHKKNQAITLALLPLSPSPLEACRAKTITGRASPRSTNTIGGFPKANAPPEDAPVIIEA